MTSGWVWERGSKSPQAKACGYRCRTGACTDRELPGSHLNVFCLAVPVAITVSIAFAVLALEGLLDRRQMAGGFLFEIGVGEDFVLVVPKDDILSGSSDDILGKDRNLPSSSGRVDDVARNRQAGGMPAEFVHDFQPLAHRGAEIIRSFGQVSLIEIVGPDPHRD